MQTNVSKTERAISGAVGFLLLLRSLRGKSGESVVAPMRLVSGALGAGLLFRGASGHCSLYAHYDTDSENVLGRLASAQARTASVCINKSMDEVRSFLRDGEWDSCDVRPTDGPDRFKCTVADRTWTLRLEPYGDGKRTLMFADIPEMKTTAGRIAALVFNSPVRGLSTTVLRNFKALMETGEIATIVGQPHGDRSAIGSQIGSLVDKTRVQVDELSIPAAQDANGRQLNRSQAGGASL